MPKLRKEKNIYERMYENRQLLSDMFDAYEYGKFDEVEKWNFKQWTEKGIELAKQKTYQNEDQKHDELRLHTMERRDQHEGERDGTGSGNDREGDTKQVREEHTHGRRKGTGV